MKGGLRDAPLAQPEVVLARQQAVAERHPQLVVERTLVIVARVVLQDVTDVGGIGDEVAAPRTNLEVDDVAEAARGLHEDAGRIASDGRQHAEDRHAARPRRKRACGVRSSRSSHETTIDRELSRGSTISEIHEIVDSDVNDGVPLPGQVRRESPGRGSSFRGMAIGERTRHEENRPTVDHDFAGQRDGKRSGRSGPIGQVRPADPGRPSQSGSVGLADAGRQHGTLELLIDSIRSIERTSAIFAGLGSRRCRPRWPGRRIAVGHKGVMYVISPNDADSGGDAALARKVWEYRRDLPEIGPEEGKIHHIYTGAKRGLALFGDRIFTVSSDNSVISLDARTGKVVWDVSREATATSPTPAAPLSLTASWWPAEAAERAIRLLRDGPRISKRGRNCGGTRSFPVRESPAMTHGAVWPSKTDGARACGASWSTTRFRSYCIMARAVSARPRTSSEVWPA